MPGSRTPPRSQTTPAITPLEAREFGETLDDAARAQLLCAAELSRWFDFRKATLLGSGSFGSVRCLLGDNESVSVLCLESACCGADGGTAGVYSARA